MKKFLLSVLLAFGLFSAPAQAQQPAQAFIVSSCGTLPAGVTYAASTYGIITMDTTGKTCDGASGGITGTVTANQGTGGASAWLVTGTGGTFPVTGAFWPYALGQNVMASSVPVVIASDQSAVPAKLPAPATEAAGSGVVNVPTSESGTALAHSAVTALGTSLVAKASAGNLFGFYCGAITGGAAGYCIAYNGSSVPGTGALTGANVLDTCYFDTTARGCSLARITFGANYSTGIVILLSSAATPFTYTTGTDTGYISADYK